MPKKNKNQTIVVNDVEEFTEQLDQIAKAVSGPRIEIIKAKITKDLTLEVEYSEIISDDTVNEVSKKCDNLVHDDLKQAFAALKPHLALICDLREGVKLNPNNYDAEKLSALDVTGIAITPGDDGGVVLIAKKKIGSKVLNLVSPFTKYADENDPYAYADDLASQVDICVNEVLLYLEGKAAVKQNAIDFEENENEHEAAA